MTGYQKLKEQLEEMTKSREYQLNRATAYFIAFTSHIEKDSEQMRKIIETARYLFQNCTGEDHEDDPLLKIYEKR